MKATESKTAATTAKNNSPFFSKSSEQGFFGSTGNKKSFFNNRPSTIQTKLTVGAPGDMYEKEADSMADKVVQRLSESSTIQAKPISNGNSITPFIQKKCAHCEEEEKLQKKESGMDKEEKEHVQRKCEHCEQEEKLQKKPIFESNQEEKQDKKNIQRKCAACEQEEKLQKKSEPSSAQHVGPGIESSLHSSKGSGVPLSQNARSQMESSFGADFNSVRIHNNSSAASMNKDLNAHAFTHGSDIYFNSGKFDTDSKTGQHLLAHELTHVIQQRSQGQSLQRFVACGVAKDCPPRDAGEATRSKTTPHDVQIYEPKSATEFGILVSNFSVDENHVKPSITTDPTWLALVGNMGGAANEEWEALGFTDCQGTDAKNLPLRSARAVELVSLMPATASRLVTKTGAGSFTDCIGSNLNETGRKLNRSVLIRRLPGSIGPKAPSGFPPIGPVRPPGAPGKFCVPYSGLFAGTEAAADRQFLETVWLRLVNRSFGPEVHDLWRDYLNRPKGSSLAPRVFRGSGNRIVDSFKTDPETVTHQAALTSEIKLAAAKTPEANVPFSGAHFESPRIPLGTLLPATSLSRAINYKDPDKRIPGNIAGGTSPAGVSSSDAGPDVRLFRGTVKIIREKTGSTEKKSIAMEIEYQVVDAVDFCPGAPGGIVAQRFTIPMSRLEATPTEATYDLPFHVFVDLSGTDTLP